MTEVSRLGVRARFDLLAGVDAVGWFRFSAGGRVDDHSGNGVAKREDLPPKQVGISRERTL